MPSPPLSEKAVEAGTAALLNDRDDWEADGSAAPAVRAIRETDLVLDAALPILHAEWRERLWREVEPVVSALGEEIDETGSWLTITGRFRQLVAILDPEQGDA